MTKQKVSLRLSERLFNLVVSIQPLFDSFTDSLEYVILTWEGSQPHLNCIEKIELRRLLDERLEKHKKKMEIK